MRLARPLPTVAAELATAQRLVPQLTEYVDSYVPLRVKPNIASIGRLSIHPLYGIEFIMSGMPFPSLSVQLYKTGSVIGSSGKNLELEDIVHSCSQPKI